MFPEAFGDSVAPNAKSVLDILMPATSGMQGSGRIVSAPLPADFDITSETNAILLSVPVSPPSVIEKVRPVYPAEARAAGIDGKVILKVVILFDGTIGNIEISKSSGGDDFDKSAIECVKQWKFRPAIQSGIRVTMAVQVPIAFEMKNR